MNRTHLAALSVLFLVFALCGAGCRALAPPIKWNVTQIEWQTYDAGISRAQAERKPICLVFYADWCEPCKVYSHVFEDARVIERARDFVMIRVNAEERPDLDRKFRVDGDYIPRTYFLTPDGLLLKGAHALRVCSRYSYSHKDPASLLAGMELSRKLASDSKVSPDEDPFTLTLADAAQACASNAGDVTCTACMKARCCADLITCANDAAACMCATPPRGAARASLTACLAAQCAAECSKMQGGT